CSAARRGQHARRQPRSCRADRRERRRCRAGLGGHGRPAGPCPFPPTVAGHAHRRAAGRHPRASRRFRGERGRCRGRSDAARRRRGRDDRPARLRGVRRAAVHHPVQRGDRAALGAPGRAPRYSRRGCADAAGDGHVPAGVLVCACPARARGTGGDVRLGVPRRRPDRPPDGGDIPMHTAATAFTMPFNLTGMPALSLPCGQGRDGLPMGIQLVGARGQDWRVLEVGARLEDLLAAGGGA
ncbi:MAG: hypothetical protein IH616_02720, partial [Gemmatimonadales bacterium]|nr:hypothetical protein [Gemmatimonadales bacterium]